MLDWNNPDEFKRLLKMSLKAVPDKVPVVCLEADEFSNNLNNFFDNPSDANVKLSLFYSYRSARNKCSEFKSFSRLAFDGQVPYDQFYYLATFKEFKKDIIKRAAAKLKANKDS